MACDFYQVKQENFMLNEMLIPLLAIALAEIGDKTQLTLLCLAAKTRKHMRLFFGAMAAFFIVDGIAVLAGELVAQLVPIHFVKIISGILFIGFGFSFILQKNEDHVTCSLKQPFLSAFSMILFSEMGDKTQITSALFASNYRPCLVLIGVIVGLAIVSFVTIQFGKQIMSKVNSNLLHKISGIIFILLGIFAFISIIKI